MILGIHDIDPGIALLVNGLDLFDCDGLLLKSSSIRLVTGRG